MCVMARFPSRHLICLDRLRAGCEGGQDDAYANHSDMLMGGLDEEKLAKITREWGQLACFN